MDFAMFERNTSKSSPYGSHCHVYVIFKELGGNDESSGGSLTVCGGKQRIHQVYTSITHKVEVRVLRRNRNFIVNYTGNYSANLISSGKFQTEVIISLLAVAQLFYSACMETIKTRIKDPV